MAAAKADTDAPHFRKLVRFAREAVFFVEREEDAVIPGKKALAQVRLGNAEPDLPEKDNGLRLRLL